uniref:Uncharacterized protein n=1 Tax=Anguilla anguilla TaxID=7936 RepID=A0A0E9XQ33_ANGAN
MQQLRHLGAIVLVFIIEDMKPVSTVLNQILDSSIAFANVTFN